MVETGKSPAEAPINTTDGASGSVSQPHLTPERLRSAVWDASLDPFIIMKAIRDANGDVVDFEYTDANEAALAYNKVTREQLIGARLLELLPGHKNSSLMASYVKTVDTGEPLQLDDFFYPNDIWKTERRYDIRAVKVDDSLAYSWRDVTERYLLNVRFRMLAENASDIVLEIDVEGVIRWMSPSVTRHLGLDPDTLIGTSTRELIWPEDWHLVQEERLSVLLGNAPQPIEVRYRDSNGSPHWMRGFARAVRGHSGDIISMVIGLVLIDVEVETRLLLHDAEKAYDVIAKNSTDIILHTDKVGLIEWISPSVQSILGLKSSQLIGTSATELFFRADIARLRAWGDFVRAGDRLANIEVMIRRADGQFQWMRMNAQPYRRDDAAISGTLISLSNIHSEVAIRRALNTLSSGTRNLIRAESDDELLHSMCEAALADGGYEFAWYGLKKTDDSQKVEPICVTEQHRDYLAAIRISWAEEDIGRGPVGRAIRTGLPVIVQDIMKDSWFGPWKSSALQHGFRSLIALPVSVHGEIDGSWQIYAPEPNAFNEAAVAALTELSAQIGFGLTRLRDLESLRHSLRQEMLMATAVEQSAESIIVTDPDGTILFVNEALCESSGYSRDELLGENPRIFQSGVHSLPFYESLWRDLVAGRSWNGVLINRRKNGRVHLEQTLISPVKDEHGAVAGYLGVKHDPLRLVTAEQSLDTLQRDVADITEIERSWRPGATLKSSAMMLCSQAVTLNNVDAACLFERRVDGSWLLIGSGGTEMFSTAPGISIRFEEALHTVVPVSVPELVDMSPEAWLTSSENILIARSEGLQTIMLIPISRVNSPALLLMLASKSSDVSSQFSSRSLTFSELAKLFSELLSGLG